jgi:hypothetical protein
MMNRKMCGRNKSWPIFNMLSWDSPRGAEEYYRKVQSRQPVYQLQIKPGISWIQVKSIIPRPTCSVASWRCLPKLPYMSHSIFLVFANKFSVCYKTSTGVIFQVYSMLLWELSMRGGGITWHEHGSCNTWNIQEVR